MSNAQKAVDNWKSKTPKMPIPIDWIEGYCAALEENPVSPEFHKLLQTE